MPVTVDFRFFGRMPFAVCIILVAIVVGHFNQTDMYEKVNALPDDRNELTPIKGFFFEQLNQTNCFNFSLDVKCALDVTKQNIIRSMKFRIENDYFSHVLPITFIKPKNVRENKLEGSVFSQIYGPNEVQFMYMYQPLSSKNATLKMMYFYSFNTLIAVYGGEYDEHSYSRTCVANGTLHLFSQEKIQIKKEYNSLGNTEFFYSSITNHNYKDFKNQSKCTNEKKDGNLFIATINNPLDQFYNIYGPITKHKALNKRSLVNYVITINSRGKPVKPEIFGLEKALNINYLPYDEPVCFNEVFLRHYNDVNDTYLSSMPLAGVEMNNIVSIIGKKEDYGDKMIQKVKDICNSSTITEITDDLSVVERIKLTMSSKYILSNQKQIPDYSQLIRGTFIQLQSDGNQTNAMQIDSTALVP